MKDEIKDDLFSSANKMLLIGLIIFILILDIIGSVGLYSFHKSNERTIHYYHLAKDARDIQTFYRTQVKTWNYMIQSTGNDSLFHSQYYEFSKLSDRIQDDLFNLKIKFTDEERNTSEEIAQLRSFHKQVSEKYISIAFDKTSNILLRDYSSIMSVMKEDEAKIFDGLEKIVTSSINLADKEIGKTAKYYFFTVVTFFVMLTALAIIMIVMIIKEKRGG